MQLLEVLRAGQDLKLVRHPNKIKLLRLHLSITAQGPRRNAQPNLDPTP